MYYNVRTSLTNPEKPNEYNSGRNYKVIDLDTIAYLMEDYDISADWLLTGKGGVFNKKKRCNNIKEIYYICEIFKIKRNMEIIEFQTKKRDYLLQLSKKVQEYWKPAQDSAMTVSLKREIDAIKKNLKDLDVAFKAEKPSYTIVYAYIPKDGDLHFSDETKFLTKIVEDENHYDIDFQRSNIDTWDLSSKEIKDFILKIFQQLDSDVNLTIILSIKTN